MILDLTQLIYVSRWNGRLQPEALEKLIAQSASNNRRRDVSGVLFVHGRALMQLLEGDAPVIAALFDTIQKDLRHGEIDCLLRKPIAKRLYPEWGMGLTNLNSPLVLDRDRLRRIVSDLDVVPSAKGMSLESRVLLNDFQQQARCAA